MSDTDTSRTPSDRDLMGHIVRKGVPLIVLLLVLGAGYFLWSRLETAPGHEAPAEPAPALPVRTVTVEYETVPQHPSFLGRTVGSQVVEIRARVEGYLLEQQFEEGTRVEKGQPLFQIDPRPFETDLATARARLASASATHERAVQQVNRFEELTERQSATRGELEDWQQQEAVAAADMEMARAEIEAAQLNLEYTRIEAPITGMIGEALKEVGSYVDSGANGLVAVIRQVDPIEVRFSVTEQELLKWNRQVASGEVTAPPEGQMPVEIVLADGSVYPHEGLIRYVDVAIDETTGTAVVRATAPNPDRSLRPGQFVHVRPLGIARVGVIRVPQNAVLQSPTGMSVYVVNDENKIETRLVTAGDWSGDDYWIIEKGLSPGDRVVTSRLLQLRPGSVVTIRPEEGGDHPAGGGGDEPSGDDGADS